MTVTFDPVIASIKTITPTTIQAAARLKDALSLLDNQIRIVWQSHKESVDTMGIDQNWNKKTWRSWKSKTMQIWEKTCWPLVRIIKELARDKQIERAQFFDYLKDRCTLVDESGLLGNTLHANLDLFFTKDSEKAAKRNVTLQAKSQEEARKAAIDRAEEARKNEAKQAVKRRKVEIQDFAKTTGISEDQAAFIRNFKDSKNI